MNESTIINNGNFTLANRQGLQSKIKIKQLCQKTDKKTEITMTCNNRLKSLQSDLKKVKEAKNNGDFTFNGLPIESVILQRSEDIKTFLVENAIVPTEKAMQTLIEFASEGKTPHKNDKFPKFGYDYVLSDEQSKVIGLHLANDKTWLNSIEGQKVEKAFASLIQKNIGQRKFKIGARNGKQIIQGAYVFESEVNANIKSQWDKRLAHKNAFLLSLESKSKSIEEKTISELRLELKSRDLPTKGKKIDLVNRIKAFDQSN
jgi:hypothetical protein